MPASRYAKIVATLGPASSSDQQIEALIRGGVDVFRLNFSHGERAQHGLVIERVRAAADRLGRHIALLQDLQGPKIRTGRLQSSPVQLADGSELVITTRDVAGTAELLSTTYAGLPGDVRPGDSLLLDDGKIRLEVLAASGQELRARVVHGGPLGEHKGINLPGVRISAPSLTDKDRVDLAYGLERGVDYVALSFIREASEVRQARLYVEQELGTRVPLIVKLEKPEAIANLGATTLRMLSES